MIRKEFNSHDAKLIELGALRARIVTRDGRPARIVNWNAKGSHPIVALVDLGQLEKAHQYTLKGRTDSRDFVKTNSDLLIEEEGGEE